MWKLDHKEDWVLKNWCFWTVVLKKTLESPLDCKEIKPVNPKGNQPWIFSLGWLVLKQKLQYFGHLMGRADSLEKTWCWERLKAGGEGGNSGWDGWMASSTHCTWIWETLGDNEGQRSLECCSPWGHKELDTTEWLYLLAPWKKSYDQPRQQIKSKDIILLTKGQYSQSYGFFQ